MSFVDSLKKGLFGGEDDYDDQYIDDGPQMVNNNSGLGVGMDDAEEEPVEGAQKKNKVVNIHATTQLPAVLGDRDLLGQALSAQDLQTCLQQILLQTVHLRDNASNRQGRSLYKQAVCYLEEHYTDEALSLNQVAREISVSANYLSAVFSQEMGMTFTEYVTGKRMEKAKELLRTTNKRSGEVAFAVGYRDPHYFSFLFKKTQGCTPRDYRAGGGRA